MKVRFCGSCRRLVLADFSFCPYCGMELGKGPELAESLEGPFARLGAEESRKAADEGVVGRILELGARLDLIEVELDVLLGSRSDN